MAKVATVQFIDRKAKRTMIEQFRNEGYAIDVIQQGMFGNGKFVVFEDSWDPANSDGIVTVEDVPEKHQPA